MPTRGRLRTWTDEQFAAAVASHTNFTDVIRALGLRPAGGNHLRMRKHAARLGLGTARFDDERRVRGLRLAHERARLDPPDVSCAASRATGKRLRRYARQLVLPVACASCGDPGERLRALRAPSATPPTL
jgi:hypothetical protein